MWIMLIQKLPTVVSPPKLSIFWAQPWLDHKIIEDQKLRFKAIYKYAEEDIRKIDFKKDDFFYDEFGAEQNWNKALGILYKSEQIRVFSNEYAILKPENLKMYVLGTNDADPSHQLVSEDVTGAAKIKEFVMDGDLRPIYDAALLDGCNPAQAMAVASGIDISKDKDFGITPLGWYKCRPEYAEYYCTPYEMEETDRREEEKVKE